MTTAQDGGKFVSLTHRPPLPTGNAPGTHFCYRLSRPQGHSAIGRILCQWNIPVTPVGIEPASFQFVAQHLNHCATAGAPLPLNKMRLVNVLWHIILSWRQSWYVHPQLQCLVTNFTSNPRRQHSIQVGSAKCKKIYQFPWVGSAPTMPELIPSKLGENITPPTRCVFAVQTQQTWYTLIRCLTAPVKYQSS